MDATRRPGAESIDDFLFFLDHVYLHFMTFLLKNDLGHIVAFAATEASS